MKKGSKKEATDLTLFVNPATVKVRVNNEVKSLSPEEVSKLIGRPFRDTIVIPKQLQSTIDTSTFEDFDPQIIEEVLLNRQGLIISLMGEAGFGLRTDNKMIPEGTPLVFYPGVVECESEKSIMDEKYTKSGTVTLKNKKIDGSYKINASQNCGYGALLPFLPTEQMLDDHFIVDPKYKNSVACENLTHNIHMFINGIQVTCYSAKKDIAPNSIIGWDYGMNYYLGMLYSQNDMKHPAFMLFDKIGNPLDFDSYITTSVWVVFNLGSKKFSAVTINYYTVLKAIKEQSTLNVDYKVSTTDFGKMNISWRTLKKLFIKQISSEKQLELLVGKWEELLNKQQLILKKAQNLNSDNSFFANMQKQDLLAKYNEMKSYSPSSNEELAQLRGIAWWLIKLKKEKESFSQLETEMYPETINTPSLMN